MSRTLSFGDVDLHPGGDSIVIDAREGAATPDSERSVCSGGRSGMIVLRSLEDVHATIIYPNAVFLHNSSGKSVTIKDIEQYSQYANGGVDVLGGNKKNVHIGGVVSLKGGAQGSYSGDVPLLIDFD